MVALVLVVSIVYSLPNLYISYPALEVKNNDKINLPQIIKIIDSNIKPEDVIQKDNKYIFKFNNSKNQLDAYNKIRLSDIGASFTLSSYTNIPNWLKSIFTIE